MPRYINPKKTQQYPMEFKAKAVKLSYFAGSTVKGVAESLDIHPFMLSRWRKEEREGKIVSDKRRKSITKKSKAASDNTTIAALEKEFTDVKLENELLKKWQRFLAEQR